MRRPPCVLTQGRGEAAAAMPKSCRAPNCSNAAGQARGPGRRLSFYKFPLQDAARLRRWLAQMRQEHWVPTRHQHLCSDHFEPSCFEYRWGVRYLRPDAVPTIFPGPGAPPKRPSPGKPPAAPQPEHPPPENQAAPAAPAQPPDPDRAAPEAVTVPLRPASPAARPLRPLEPGVPEEPPAPSPAPRAPAERGGEAAAAVPPPVLAYVETVPAAAAAPEPLASPALPLPLVSAVPVAEAEAARGELSTGELLGVVLVLQRKVKVLQQRHRRHCARLEAMEGLLEQLRRAGPLPRGGLELLEEACLQPEPPEPAGAVTIICGRAEDALLYAVPPPGTPGTLGTPGTPGTLGTLGTPGTPGGLGPQRP